MMERITFLSLQGNTMNSDIRYIQRILREDFSDCRFALMAQNIDIADKEQVKRKKASIKENLENADCIFSFDGTFSLPNWPTAYAASKKVLYLEPFDYLYKNIESRAFLNKLIKGYTDVIVPGKELTNFVESNCDLSSVTIHGNVNIPYIEWLRDETEIKLQRELFDAKFPWCKGKKLIVFLTTTLRKGQKKAFQDVEVSDIINNLPDNTVFVTNNESLFASSVSLDKQQQQSFVFVRRLFRRNNLASIGDVLITDDSYLWSCHYSAGKNVYYYPYRKCNFMKYANKYLKERVITDLPTQINGIMELRDVSGTMNFNGDVPLENVLKKIFN